LSKAAAKQHPSSAAAGPESIPSARKQKITSFLVTGDDELWPQIGAHHPQKLNHRQIDSVEELLGATKPGESALIVWDARGTPESSAVLARIQAHSPRFAIVALDAAESASAWASQVERGQIVAMIGVPVVADQASSALAGAYEEASARAALLGADAGVSAHQESAADRITVEETPSSTQAAPTAAAGSRMPLIVAGGVLAVLLLALCGYLIFRRDESGASFSTPSAAGSSTKSAGGAENEEKVDALIAEAQRAMRDRHFIDPSDGSALSLYRSALVLDPSSGEAQQGLKRLMEILVARVQSALDEKQFDSALQALETVRSIDPNDQRLSALDARIAKMRDELGPAEIQAAINAQNFDRAEQLLDQAAKNKSLSEQKIAQLREDLRRHRGDSDVARLVTLIDTRLQQNQLLEPPNDSAVYYLTQARKSGASSAEIQSQSRELVRRLGQEGHAAIDQHRLSDAEKIAGMLHAIGAPLSSVAALQRDIGVARAQPVVQKPDTGHFVDLVKSRLEQGSVVGPENDNALYYLGQLRTMDPQNASLPQLSKAVQTQILDQARQALDAGELGHADAMLQLASGLGSSPELDSLNDRLHFAQSAPSMSPKAVSEASLTRVRKLEVDYPPLALRNKTEGTVEIGYVVTQKGQVSDIKVIDANPANVFEKAAINAVSRLRYQPYMEGGKAIPVATKMLVIFRLAS
jgi:TonB family protein